MGAGVARAGGVVSGGILGGVWQMLHGIALVGGFVVLLGVVICLAMVVAYRQ
jgi:hypothetical protein